MISRFMMEAVIVRRHVLDIIAPFVLLVLCDCTDVSLTPEGYAPVTVSGSLSLTCRYSGSGIPQAAVWTLNDTAVPLTVFLSSCQRLGSPPGLPYDILRYNFTCTSMSNTLNIYSITANDFLCWNCTFTLSVGQADHKSRTCITLATTTTTTTTSRTTTATTSGTSIATSTATSTATTTQREMRTTEKSPGNNNFWTVPVIIGFAAGGILLILLVIIIIIIFYRRRKNKQEMHRSKSEKKSKSPETTRV